jgi:hypothetical protein
MAQPTLSSSTTTAAFTAPLVRHNIIDIRLCDDDILSTD